MTIDLRFYQDGSVYLWMYFADINDLKEQWDRLFIPGEYVLEGQQYDALRENGKILYEGEFRKEDISTIEEAYNA